MYNLALLLKNGQVWRPSSTSATLTRYMTNTVSTARLEYDTYGVPSEVIQHRSEITTVDLKPGQTLVKFLASPINPADINTIQAK